MISHVQHNTTQSRTTQSRTIQYKHNTEDLRGEPFNACAEGYVQSYPDYVQSYPDYVQSYPGDVHIPWRRGNSYPILRQGLEP